MKGIIYIDLKIIEKKWKHFDPLDGQSKVFVAMILTMIRLTKSIILIEKTFRSF